MAQDNTTTYTYSNETFSGCDMTAQIVVSTTNDDGTTSSTHQIIGELQTVSYSINMEKRPVRSIGNVNAKDYVMGQRTIAGSLVFSVFNKHFSKNIMESLNSKYSGTSFLADEIPPFDIVISAANEYGYRSRLVIYGVRLLNEGQVMSINDVYTENTYQYFATDLEYLSDEMTYTRSLSDRKYKLVDNIESNPYGGNTYYDATLEVDREKEINNYWEKRLNDSISLLQLVTQPTKKNGKGIVDFFIKPGQKSGTIYIVNSDGDVTTMKIKADDSTNQNNTVGYASIKLPPDSYVAYFENDNSIKSNESKFKIKHYSTASSSNKIVPTIEELTPTSVTIYCNEDSHNKVKVYDSDGEEYIYDLKKSTLKIKDLEPNSLYTLKTYSDDEESVSVTISFTTPQENDLYDNFIKYIKANKKELDIDDIDEYIKMIKDNMDLSTTPSDAINKARSNYKNQLSMLNPNTSNYAKKREELERKIEICSNLLLIASKLNNDYISAINEKNYIPIPKIFLDKNYNYIFQFGEYVDTAEFFRDYGSVKQLAATVKSYNFKTIDDKDNCFRFVGKGGVKHYVQAIIKGVRSPKLEFYVMTNKEKEKYLNNNSSDLSQEDIDKIINGINNEGLPVNYEQRAFMFNAKKINNPKIINPTIIEINPSEVIVKSNLNDFIHESKDKLFYLAIASYEGIINNKDLYKIDFTNTSDYIAISPIYHGIKKGLSYAIWIEDSDGNQISNPSTFVYDPEAELDLNNEYELKYIIDTINSVANSNLSADIRDNIYSITKNNDSIESNVLIKNILSILTSNYVPMNNLYNFLYKLKNYIGVFGDSSDSIINNLKFDKNILSFNSSIDGTLIMYCDDNIFNFNIENNTAIDVSLYKSNILILIASNSDLNEKSNLIIINKKDKTMEVI